METILGDVDRARSIYELAVSQKLLDMPEVLWKAYIDFEIEQEEYIKTRGLYERLLKKTQHVKVSKIIIIILFFYPTVNRCNSSTFWNNHF